MIRSRKLLCLAALVIITTAAWTEEPDRIDFLVSTVETSGNETGVISQVRVDGPPGTDFTIRFDSGRFEMNARFRTERTGDDALKIRSHLETRRFYGMSERNLALYEEDVQRSAIDLRFGDVLLLYPFGGEDEADNLKVEIVPGLSERSPVLPAGGSRPLEIDVVQSAPGGVVTVWAEKIPHWFEVTASVLSNGVELARGHGRMFIEERGRVVIEPRERPPLQASAPDRLLLDLSVDRLERSRPSEHVAISFDIVEETDGRVGGPAVAANWAGGLSLGSSLIYELPTGLFEPGAKTQIEIGVHLAGSDRGVER